MGKVLPSQRLLKQFEERLVFGEMNLSEIVQSGAQMMLQYALEREVTEALGRNLSIIIICPGLDSRPGLPSSTCWRAWSAREGRC